MKMSRITVLFLVIVFLSSLLSMGSGVQAAVTFTAPELLGRPTDTSITVNVVPNRDDETYFEYGTTSGSYTGQTNTARLTNRIPTEVVITGLTPDETAVEYVRPNMTEVSHSHTIEANVTNHAPNQPTLIAPSDESVGIGSEPTLEVTVIDPDTEPMDVTFHGRVAEDFTMIVLPDTQFYSQTYPRIFTTQTEWIVANQDALNIIYVAHEGDIVQTASILTEWENADAAMTLLEDPVATGLPQGIPYGVLPGNHDMPTTNYNTYFGVSRFNSRGYYGGHYSNTNDNNYSLFSASGMDFIVINLQYQPSTAVLDWADDLLKTYSDRRAIVISHHILNTNGSWGQEAIFTSLKDNPNLFLMLCGHAHNEIQRMETGDYGNTIYVLLADYADYPYGGNGYLRILEFSPADDEISVETYSPWLDSYETDPDSQFVLPYEMEDLDNYTPLGTVSNVASGGNALFHWTGLAEDITYQWYVEVSDGSETTTSPTWSFTTGNAVDYDLTIVVDPPGDGTTNPSVGVHTYVEDAVIPVTATPVAGYTFVNWTGDVADANSAVTTITMDGHKIITAHFIPEEYTLTVNVVGNGSVTKNPDQATYYYNDVVELTATADPDWTFIGWSVDLSGTTNHETITMNGNKMVTATFTQSGGTGGGGGGSGGTGGSGGSTGGVGGGTGGGMPMGVTFFTGKVNAQNMFVENITAQSYNKQVTIIIPQGTTGKTPVGRPLAWISIIPTDDYPIPTEYLSMISLPYDVAPYRSTFDPDIKIMISYNPSKIEDGIDELDLHIYTYDEQTSQWIPLESHVDPENNTVWAEISDLSLYAVMVDTRPADISVTGLTITPEEIYEGEEATVDALLVNSGGSTGSYEATLKINGTVKETKVVDVGKNESVAISFHLIGLESGTHQIAIGEAVGTLTILEVIELKPAIFTVSSLAISPDEADIGEDVNITVRVNNTGETEGVYQLVCKVNGVVVDEKEITLTGGSVELIVFITTFDEAGNMTIEINGLTGSLVVRELEEEPSLEPEPGTVAEIPTQGILEEHISGSRWFVIWVLIGVCLVFSVRSAINFYIRRLGRDKRVNNN